MNIEEIKVGETYYVRVKVTATSGNRFVCRPLLWGDTMSDFAPNFFNFAEAEAFNKLYPVPEQPKHDPCRLFKAGDVVEYRPKDGRANPNLLVGRRYKVSVDEPCDTGIVQVECDGLRHIDTFVAYNNLELVTPVEELEPYKVHAILGDNGTPSFFAVRKGDVTVAAFFCDTPRAFTEEQALAAAEAERDRLNAEYRKERENG